ncbi:BrnT family toxin [Rugamonas sp.]|uniref:BrnT family toxin n=1 Tax=Rugamonas sp. TaxID=1926287 RepID=UPI0025D6FCC7|nr:BrnT family toxin [Rugamonas sp.]
MTTITFDPRKDQLNRRKHGISLAQARRFDWAHADYWMDMRHHYGESRECAAGSIGQRLYVVVFVWRNGMRRIISLRKANDREEKRYVKNT